jgi:NO-binding membrane sensor protein with MHYT domain
MRALKTTGIVMGVGALIYLGLGVVSATMFMDFRRTSLAVAIVAGMGLTCVALGIVRQASRETVAEAPLTLIGVGATLMAFAAIYAVLINESVA